jgi:electron transport complex protein RnfE
MRSELAPTGTEHWDERAVALVASLPALVAATTAGTGAALGVAMAAILLATTVIGATFADLAAPARLAICAVVAGALAICCDLVAHAFLPDLRTALGPFLLATAPAALLHVAGSTGRTGAAGALRTALLAVAAFVAIGAIRELLGRGTLLADVGLLAGRDAAAWQVSLPWRGALAAVELPGALLAIALLLVSFGPRAKGPRP